MKEAGRRKKSGNREAWPHTYPRYRESRHILASGHDPTGSRSYGARPLYNACWPCQFRPPVVGVNRVLACP